VRIGRRVVDVEQSSDVGHHETTIAFAVAKAGALLTATAAREVEIDSAAAGASEGASFIGADQDACGMTVRTGFRSFQTRAVTTLAD
jgi:hypothetical protein